MGFLVGMEMCFFDGSKIWEKKKNPEERIPQGSDIEIFLCFWLWFQQKLKSAWSKNLFCRNSRIWEKNRVGGRRLFRLPTSHTTYPEKLIIPKDHLQKPISERFGNKFSA